MKKIGRALMAVGVAVGAAAGLWVALGPEAFGQSWIIGVALIKLTLAASLGLIAAGAIALRMGLRADLRESPPVGSLEEGSGAARPLATRERSTANDPSASD